MKGNGAPKIIINDDYLDLREQTHSIPAKSSVKDKSSRMKHSCSTKIEGKSTENDLVKTGLQKLFGNPKNLSHITNSPRPKENGYDSRFRRTIERTENTRSDTIILKAESSKADSSTSDSLSSVERHKNESSRIACTPEPEQHAESSKETLIKSKEISENTGHNEHKENIGQKDEYTMTDTSRNALSWETVLFKQAPNQTMRLADMRLLRRNEILYMPPFRKTWTLPSFPVRYKELMDKSDNFNTELDRRTYNYDGDSDVDSESDMIPLGSMKQSLTGFFQTSCLHLISLVGCVCGLIIVAAIFAWITKIFEVFKPQKELPPSMLLVRVIDPIISPFCDAFKSFYRLLNLSKSEIFDKQYSTKGILSYFS